MDDRDLGRKNFVGAGGTGPGRIKGGVSITRRGLGGVRDQGRRIRSSGKLRHGTM